MSDPRITLLGSHAERLQTHFENDLFGHERAAIVLFRRFGRPVQELEPSDRFVSVDVIPFAPNWVVSSSPAHIRFELKHLRDLFRRCEDEDLVFGFAHNHVYGPLEFSEIDEGNEGTLLEAVANRNGRHIHFIALLYSQGKWVGRVRAAMSPDKTARARHVIVLGSHLTVYRPSSIPSDKLFARQAAAFGAPFVENLRSLRIGVIGCGGTGSPTVTLLTRAGVGEIVLIDGDSLEKSNLNRVRGARLTDIGSNKALVLQHFVNEIGLSTQIAAYECYVDSDPSAVDALSSCDVIFGCTDDQIGREVVNIAVYAYGLAYIDVGLGGQIGQTPEGDPVLRYHFGRISTMLPEFGECLFCQGVVSERWIQHQYALRDNPNLSAEEAAERYLQGGGEQAPGVGPFTSAVADFGVATLFDLLKPFRKFPPELRRDAFRIDFVKMEFRSVQEKNDAACPFCGTHELLLSPEKYRLHRPALGRVHAQV
jgi:molybdopterin/thiamine biosynthesis adenylyltransferase